MATVGGLNRKFCLGVRARLENALSSSSGSPRRGNKLADMRMTGKLATATTIYTHSLPSADAA